MKQDVQQHGQHDRGQDRDQHYREASERAAERAHVPVPYTHVTSFFFVRLAASGRVTSFVPVRFISGRTLPIRRWIARRERVFRGSGIVRLRVATLGSPILLLLRSAFFTLAAALVLMFSRHGGTDTPGGGS